MTPLFEFVDVHETLAGNRLLAGVTVSIPAGSFTVIAGASGSGKTSLLRLCNRLDVATSGKVLFRGADLESIDPQVLRRRVGLVFQRPVLFAGTVRDNLLTADSRATPEQLVAVLDEVELTAKFLDRIADDLSGGEAQRACLARTLLCRPEVLLMDEPTASLHPAASLALEKTAQRLNRNGNVDVVWVSHDLTQIQRLARYLIVLAAGRVIYAGEPGTGTAAAAIATLSEGKKA